MEQHPRPLTAHRLDRIGATLVVIGVVLLDALATFIGLAGAWFISTFTDGSDERGLAVIADLWPVWVVAVVLIAIVVVALAQLLRGGSSALLFGGLGGLAVASVGVGVLLAGSYEVVRTSLLLAMVAGGLLLALGAAARLAAR